MNPVNESGFFGIKHCSYICDLVIYINLLIEPKTVSSYMGALFTVRIVWWFSYCVFCITVNRTKSSTSTRSFFRTFCLLVMMKPTLDNRIDYKISSELVKNNTRFAFLWKFFLSRRAVCLFCSSGLCHFCVGLPRRMNLIMTEKLCERAKALNFFQQHRLCFILSRFSCV